MIKIHEILITDIRVILQFNMDFGRELVDLLTKSSMFGKFVVHAWR
jgi:hypothetical protein